MPEIADRIPEAAHTILEKASDLVGSKQHADAERFLRDLRSGW